eukprot:TRINITY_DN16218_c0_g1_i1.p1 TRINITY_DN16218_c0_g1~~TRINITY_DN16218_c0_g1_i1.p1  ORF type:complete len:349 (+),score=151.90 TRINITY_DN16218_c0_g1_i1:34-1047(+)
MADDPFEEEFGISIEEMGFDPRDIRSQEQYDELDEAQKNFFANIRYESSLAPEERHKIAEKRKKKKAEEQKRKAAMKATDDRREAEEKAMIDPDKANVFVPLWDGFDQVSFSTIVDILRAGGFNICTGVIKKTSVMHSTQPDLKVASRSGVSLVGDFLFELKGNANFVRFDAVVIPAGKNIDLLRGNKKFMSLVKHFSFKKKMVCGAEDAPAFLFLYQGILKGLSCTGSDAAEKEIKNSVPADVGKSVTFVKETVVVSKNIVTCRGPADAVEYALTILSNIRGSAAMVEVAKQLNYESYCDRVKENTTEPPEKKAKDAEPEAPSKKPPEDERLDIET